MNPISLVIGIIGHASLLLRVEKDISEVANNIFKLHKESFPSLQEFGELIQDAIDVLASGIIPLPSESSDKISKILGEVVKQIESILSGGAPGQGSPNVSPNPQEALGEG